MGVGSDYYAFGAFLCCILIGLVQPNVVATTAHQRSPSVHYDDVSLIKFLARELQRFSLSYVCSRMTGKTLDQALGALTLLIYIEVLCTTTKQTEIRLAPMMSIGIESATMRMYVLGFRHSHVTRDPAAE